jgi:Skp family chaperone for outer membrane proteins
MARGVLCGVAWVTSLVVVAGTFAPPRTAVVDASVVLGDYAKKKDLEARALAARKALETRYQELEKKHAELTQELKHVGQAEAEDRILTERFNLELKMKRIKEREIPEMLKQRFESIEVLRAEVEKEIGKYATANDLDLVIEKAFVLDTAGPDAYRWPIVHFSKPELDITAEITLRLNDLYKAR